MSKRIALFSALFILFVVPNFAQETFTHQAAKISVTLPAGWMYEAADGGITAYPEEGGFFVYLQVLHVDALDAALDEVDKMLNSKMDNVQLGNAQDYDVNGMSGIFVEGTADGLLMAVGVIDTPVSSSSLMVGAWGTPDVVEKYQSEIMSIFNSISPAN
jgi:predicted Zn-dependent protease